MSTAKLNAVGHHWVGLVEPEKKLNMNADTLSNFYMRQCLERLSEGTVCVTREGSRTAQQGKLAWVATLNIISHNKLTENLSQQLNTMTWQASKLRVRANWLRIDTGHLSNPRKPSREWSRGYVENGLLFRETPWLQLVLSHLYTDSPRPPEWQHGTCWCRKRFKPYKKKNKLLTGF